MNVFIIIKQNLKKHVSGSISHAWHLKAEIADMSDT